MNNFQTYLSNYEGAIVEKYKMEDNPLEIPEVSFTDKEEMNTEMIESGEYELMEDIISICEILVNTFSSIINCIDQNKEMIKENYTLTDDDIYAIYDNLYEKIGNEYVCTYVDKLIDNLEFLQNFCEQKDMDKLSVVLSKMDDILNNITDIIKYED